MTFKNSNKLTVPIISSILILGALVPTILDDRFAKATSPIILEDEDFFDSDWTLTTIVDSNPGATTVSAGQSLTGGNPDAYRVGQHDWGPGFIVVANLENNFAHNPATQGAIESIDCSLDFNVFEVSLGGGAVRIAFLLFQDGTYYDSDQSFAINEFSGWVPISINDISFTKVVGPGPTTPDLSSTGGVIMLGYETSNTTGGHRVSDFGTDNFQCALNLVEISNEAPDCSNAVPDQDSLWPPNHKMNHITVNGVTDPDGDAVGLTINTITQDEPTNGIGDGDESPDGDGVGTDTAQIRAERSGTGDGRVYEISFTADDGNGGMCTGMVSVGVPHDKKDTAVDSGQNFDSTQ
jgi:hypothetical protein